MLKVYNTLGRSLVDFKTLKPNEVTMYVCGPTVYSYLHVGNFRGPVFFNFVRNWLEHHGYKVRYALNFTDVDDKIIKRAQEENVSATEIAEKYIAQYKEDFQKLKLCPHDYNPKVSEYMPQIISFIQDLISQKMAYAVDGDVNYSIKNFSEYGKLSGRNIDDLKSGVRIEVNEKKEHPLDFALWKSAKPHENLRGSMWPSPWGEGRPGWHIECSAMVKGIFGDQIDIHGGGLDLVFPHHENEIAQSEGCLHKSYAQYWMHVNMLNFGGNKMSKSLGNVVTMKEFLDRHHSEIYKWMILSVHYRSLADFSDDSVDVAIKGLAKVYSALALADSFISETNAADEKYQAQLEKAWSEIAEALDADFGTPAAFAVMFEQIRLFNTQFRRGMKSNATLSAKALLFKNFIIRFGRLLSLFQEPAEQFLVDLDNELLKKMNVERSSVDTIVAERAQARLQKDFNKSDELRKKLTDMGVSVSDLPEGSYWEVTK